MTADTWFYIRINKKQELHTTAIKLTVSKLLLRECQLRPCVACFDRFYLRNIGNNLAEDHKTCQNYMNNQPVDMIKKKTIINAY